MLVGYCVVVWGKENIGFLVPYTIWILGRGHYVFIPRGVFVSNVGEDMSLHEGGDIG